MAFIGLTVSVGRSQWTGENKLCMNQRKMHAYRVPMYRAKVHSRYTLRMVDSGGDDEESGGFLGNFSAKAELLNGRFAMMGFFIGVFTQYVNPSHPTFLEQIEALVPFVEFIRTSTTTVAQKVSEIPNSEQSKAVISIVDTVKSSGSSITSKVQDVPNMEQTKVLVNAFEFLKSSISTIVSKVSELIK
uniref:Uncharacterized protein n=1 Tax=Timspurckia oligopyrenoides TaxID=708627 RepID=A0A7S0ZAG7_9RHOD